MKAVRTWVPLALILALLAGALLMGPSLVERAAYAAERGEQRAVRAQLAELSKADHLSSLFRAVAKAVKPAVVEIRTQKRVEVPDFEDLLPEDFPFRFRFRTPQQRSAPRLRLGLGSGVIVDAEHGYILTCYHVVGDADEVEVVLANGRKFETQWVRSDPQTDIAVVKIAPDGLTEAPLGDSDAMQVGDWVLAIGAPHRLPQTVTAGIVSAKGRYGRGPVQYQDYIQTDAAINRGNSGGPLVNMTGEVIGLNNTIAVSSVFGGNEGVGFAIPSDLARTVMDQLIDTGKVVRGFLGILPQDLTDRHVESMDLPGTNGVLVASVVEGGPADKAGLKVWDVIVRINGKETSNANQLRFVIADIGPGASVPVVLYRDGREMTVEVKLTTQPKEMAMGSRTSALRRWTTSWGRSRPRKRRPN